jgi:hypothetical protein
MTPRLRRFLPATFVFLLGLAAYWFARHAGAGPREIPRQSVRPEPRRIAKEPRFIPVEGEAVTSATQELEIELYASCRPDEVILRLPTQESYLTFLDRAAQQGVGISDGVGRLRAMRVKQQTPDDKARLAQALADYEVSINRGIVLQPSSPKADGGIQRKEALAFDDQLLPWLGVAGDNSRWGSGVKVAVLDSGIVPHPGLPPISQSVAVFPFPENLSTTYFHGTAVASMIAGTSSMARGIAPGVDLISIRVINDARESDVLSISTGLLAALDCGAEIINISLGCPEDLPILRDAVRLVIDAGILVVASSGNEGRSDARFPAAYDGVIAVGAIEAGAERMAFSNLGSGLGLTAPGYGVNAAAPGGRYISFGGTSASAPIVCGAIAATMSDGSGRRIPASEAARIVLAHADDEGHPGPDAEYGSGVLNMDRIMNRKIRGRYDAAITCQRLLPGGEQIEVTVQNRGTEILVNTLLEITTPAGTTKINATTIAPGAIQSFTVPFRQGVSGTSHIIRSKVTLGGSSPDLTPENNLSEGVARGI